LHCRDVHTAKSADTSSKSFVGSHTHRASGGGSTVKKSRAGVCRETNSRSHEKAGTYSEYNSLADCLDSGGRLQD
jgi:hypothetical protein